MESGKWTKEEHKKFLEALLEYGENWIKVQQAVQIRSCAQVRSHAQKYFIKMQKFDI
jgi:SHAQKYF class myb-like DNA-binding protein